MRGVRILYVEDEKPLCELFKTAVEAYGYLIDVAFSGEAGLAMHADAPYDIVAVDSQLPDRPGIEIAQELLEKDGDLPIIMVVGKGSERIAAEALALGISNYVIKDNEGIYLELIPSIVRNLLDQADSRRQSRAREKKLKLREAKLRSLIDNSPVEIVFKDLEGRYILANREFEERYGVTLGEIEGKTAADIHSDKAFDYIEDFDREVLETCSAIRKEVEIPYCRDGEFHTDLETRFPILDSRGDPIGLGSISIEITERHRMATLFEGRNKVLERLATGGSLEEVLSLLVTTAEEINPEMLGSVLLLDNKGRQLRHGAAPSLPAFYNEAIDGLEIGEDVGSCGAAAYTGEVVIAEDVLTHPYWVDFRDLAAAADLRACWSQPIISSAGNVLGTFAMYYHQPRQPTRFDLDSIETAAQLASIAIERTQAEEALRENEARLRAIVENSPDAISLKDIEGRYLLVNKYFETIAGMSTEAIIGRTPREVFDSDFARSGIHHDREVIESRQVISRDEKFHRGDSVTEFLTTKFPVFGSDGGIVGVGAVHVDLTEHNRTEEQLRQAQKMEAVGQLTGGVAHDFNNILHIVAGNLELAMDKMQIDTPLRSNIEAALKAVDKGAALTQQLLAFSRQQTLSPKIVDANELITDTLRLLERTLGEDIRIDTEFFDEEFLVDVDPALFGNALLNLALNARDAMPDGGVLNIRTSSVDLGGERLGPSNEEVYGLHALITVTDTGVGIDEENIDRVLEPFFTTKGIGEGTGLGLSMVYGFIHQSNGHVGVASKKGEGTTISLYLPIAKRGNRQQGDDTPLSAAALEEKTVLVVEDDPQVRATTACTLSKLGCRVIDAEDGPSAQEILDARGDTIDLVLSDVIMPAGMSGFDLAEVVGRKHPRIKMLLTSGYPDKDINQCSPDDTAHRNVTLLRKPYKRAQLVAAIKKATLENPFH